MSESKIQHEIVQALRHEGILVFSVPNDFVKDARSMGTAIAMGLWPGVSDLVAVLPGRVVFLEVKTETGRQSPKQIKFQEAIERLGFDYFVVRSISDAFKAINQ